MRRGARNLAKQKKRPPRSYNLDGFPPEAVEAANALMAELDEIHPGWRDWKPWLYPFAHRARVTWCLMRLKLVTHREGFTPAPRLDWRVHIVRASAPSQDPDRGFPHAVEPGREWHPSWYEPPPLTPAGPAKPTGPSSSELAMEFGLTLDRTERLLRNLPEGADPRAFLRNFLKRTGETAQ